MDYGRYYVKELENSKPIIYSVNGSTVGMITFSTESIEIDTTLIMCKDISSSIKQWIDLGFKQITYEQVEEFIYEYRYKVVTDNIISLEERLLKDKKILYKLLRQKNYQFDKRNKLLEVKFF